MTDPFRACYRLATKGLRVGCPCCRLHDSKARMRRQARQRLKRETREEIEA